MAIDYSQLQAQGRITDDQARNLAELVTTYISIAPQTNGKYDLTGLANLIKRDGLQAGVDWAKSVGADFRINSQIKTPYPIAKELVDRLYKDANFTSVSHYGTWLNSAQGLTPEELIEKWNKAQTKDITKSKITPEEIQTFSTKATEALPTFIQNDLNNFIQSANKIYQGYDLTPNYGPEADAKQIINNRLLQVGFKASENDLNRWNEVAERYGAGAAIAQIDRALALRNMDKAIPNFAQEEGFEGVKLTGQLPSTYVGSSLYKDMNYAGTTGNPLLQQPQTQEALVPLSSIKPTPTNPLVGTGSTTSSGIPIQGVPTPTLPQTSAPTNIPIRGVPTPQPLSTSSFIQSNLGTSVPAPVTAGGVVAPPPEEQPQRPSIFSNMPVPQPLVGTIGGQPLLQPQQPQPQQPQPQQTTEEFIQQQQPPVQMAKGGEVTDDDFIQEMLVGTRPEDEEVSKGLLPRELREAIDVPLDLANLAIRGTAGAVAGPAYGLYKGLTSEDFGTKKGVKEARSEAEQMMAKITGEPKTQAAKDLMQSLGETLEEAKIPPMPQFLTTPVPGPGAASALTRSYELTETPPTGGVKLAGDKGAKPATPPTDPMGFYSPAEKAVMNLPQDKGTASQMLAQITKTQGVKPVELRATGLEDYLKGKGNEPVTKQEIQDFLKNNPVQVDEVVLGQGQVLSPEAKRLMKEAENRMMEADNRMAPYFEGLTEGVGGQYPYSMFYKLRGALGRKAVAGDKEALDVVDSLNLPPEIKQAVFDFASAKEEYRKYSTQARKMVKPKFDKYNLEGGTNAREIYLTLPGEQKRFEVPTAHSVSPEADTNRVAHIFLDERQDAKGNNVLFVQELQSDWAQQGRDKGFYDNEPPKRRDNPEWVALDNRRRDLYNEFNRNNGRPEVQERIRPEMDRISQRLREIERPYDEAFLAIKDKLPSAPFVQNTEDWLNLALKRVIKEAVDNDIDTVAFIKGSQAAKKYGLGGVVENIEVIPPDMIPGRAKEQMRYVNLNLKGGGVVDLSVSKEGNIINVGGRRYDQLIGKPLAEVVGKEMADKVMSGGAQKIEGKSLEVGGEGMKGFYDNILPKTAEKLLKKLGGGKIEPIKVDMGNTPPEEFSRRFNDAYMRGDREQIAIVNKERLELDLTEEHLGFKITPEMKEMVKTEGLPKFAAGGEVTDFIKRAA